jgi:hypothetical protein
MKVQGHSIGIRIKGAKERERRGGYKISAQSLTLKGKIGGKV